MTVDEFKIEVPFEIITNWQEIVDILAEIIKVPAGLIMKYDDPEIVVLVSSRSKGNPYIRGQSEKLWSSGLYCETVIRTGKKLMVPNALEDENWKDNPDIKLDMISYLGYPLNLPDGRPFGTICVLDNKHNSYSEIYENLIEKFSKLIQVDLEIIYANQLMGDKNRKLLDYIDELKTLREITPICSNCKSIQGKDGQWHSLEKYLSGNLKTDLSHGICPKCLNKLYPEVKNGN